MKPSADPSPFPTYGEARRYLEAAGLKDFAVPGSTFELANALCRLIGPDLGRLRTARRLLGLVDAATTRGLGVEIRPPYTDAPTDMLWLEHGDGFDEAVAELSAELAAEGSGS